MSTSSTATTAEGLRDQHGVQLVSGDQEGEAIHRLPSGVYGFTFSPFSREAPLFSRNSFLSFELHRVGEDTLILGYVDEATAGKIEKSDDVVDIDVFPVAKEQSSKLVAIPHSRISSAKPPDRLQSNRLRVALRQA
ncbi:MAG: hypothetical protein ABI823_05480 [Bryobacteraceae bacterium]